MQKEYESLKEKYQLDSSRTRELWIKLYSSLGPKLDERINKRAKMNIASDLQSIIDEPAKAAAQFEQECREKQTGPEVEKALQSFSEGIDKVSDLLRRLQEIDSEERMQERYNDLASKYQSESSSTAELWNELNGLLGQEELYRHIQIDNFSTRNQ